MPPRPWRVRIEDIIECIDAIGDYLGDTTLDAFRTDRRTVDAVIRNFIVIGEAARHIPAELTARHPEVPWHRLRGMRNVVTHEYFGIDLQIIWETSLHDLPPLVPLLRQILEEPIP